MKLYKLTDQDNKTKNDTIWEIGKTNVIDMDNRRPILCSTGVFHAYKSIELGLMMNIRHANIHNPKIFECEGKIIAEDYAKVGCYELIATKNRRTPKWYKDKNIFKKIAVAFAILCAKRVLPYFEEKYPGDERPKKSIEAAKKYLRTGSAAAARAAGCAAEYAARAAEYAARAAEYAARAADYADCVYRAAEYAVRAARAADYAVRAARAAGCAAEYAARAADCAGDKINFNILAKKAVKIGMAVKCEN